MNLNLSPYSPFYEIEKSKFSYFSKIKFLFSLLDVLSKLDIERRNDERTYPNQQPDNFPHNFLYPNEYNPTPPKFEHKIPDGNPDFQWNNPIPTFEYPHQYNPTPPKIVGNIPDVNLYKPDSNNINPVHTFKLPPQYNPTPPSIPDIPVYHPVPNHNYPILNFKYPNEYNPTQQIPKIPKPAIWRSRKRYRTRQNRQRRPYRSRRPSPTRRPQPCKPSIWGKYYGHYGM